MIRAGGVAWINAFIVAMVVLEVVLLVGLFAADLMPLGGVVALLLTVAAIALLIWVILPRSFEVYDDRLVIVFPWWRWNIGMDSIELVREGKGYQAYGYFGVRFASAPGKSVEIRRRNSNLFKRPNLIVSPDDRSLFVTEMNAALSRYRRSLGGF